MDPVYNLTELKNQLLSQWLLRKEPDIDMYSLLPVVLLDSFYRYQDLLLCLIRASY